MSWPGYRSLSEPLNMLLRKVLTELPTSLTFVLDAGERFQRKQRIVPFLTLEARARCWARSDVFWVAVEGRKVIGYMALSVAAERGEARINDLVVAEAYRRHGVATELLNHAVEWALRKDIEHMVLECALKAQPAISFALKHRFVFCGFQDGYWPGQEVGIFFRKRLR